MKASLLTATLLLSASLTSALAQSGAPGTSVAKGFNGPMGVLAAPNGDVYVIDSGTGGEQEVTTVSPKTGEEITATVGDTARIVRVSPDGTRTVVAKLPSMLMGQEATGGARLALIGDTLYATSGVWVEFAGPDALPLMAVVAKVEDGKVSEVADIWRLESAQNPDGFIEEAHPYGLAAGPDGMLYVADAGANDLVKVNSATGEVSVVAVFGGVPGPLPNPARGGAKESDPVPTGVAFDAAGNTYVSFLPGFPFAPGSAKVVRVDAEGNVSDYAVGLSMVTDLRTGPDGNLYAVQLAEWTEQGPVPNTGAVVRIEDGQAETVLGGLSFPTSIAFAEDGGAYLTINGVGAPGSGELIRVDGLSAQAD